MYKLNLNYKGIKKEVKRLTVAFCLAVGVMVLFGTVMAMGYSEKIQSGLADSLLRFHVIANSNSAEDQELKMKVREKLLNEISVLLADSDSKEMSLEILCENIEKLESTAREEVRVNGFNYNVQISVENCKFPLKKYGDITLPAGYYDALKVEIGQAKGENFWCVLYPTVCFVEESIDVDSYHKMKAVLTDDEYQIITSASGENDDIVPEIKFKIVEWFQEIK